MLRITPKLGHGTRTSGGGFLFGQSAHGHGTAATGGSRRGTGKIPDSFRRPLPVMLCMKDSCLPYMAGVVTIVVPDSIPKSQGCSYWRCTQPQSDEGVDARRSSPCQQIVKFLFSMVGSKSSTAAVATNLSPPWSFSLYLSSVAPQSNDIEDTPFLIDLRKPRRSRTETPLTQGDSERA